MKTTNYNCLKSALMIALLTLVSIAIVYADNTVEPSDPTSLTYMGNSTNTYSHGTMKNYTRGYIHTMNINEDQPTLKWIGYVGNISGKYALRDSGGYALYDWDIVTTKGEVYATKEGAAQAEYQNGQGGGMPAWENITCADQTNLTHEQTLLNHTTAWGSRSNEDAYMATFTYDAAGATGFKLQNPFWVGETVYIDGTNNGGCYGVHLNRNNTRGTYTQSIWEEIVLQDLTYELETAGGEMGAYEWQWDLIYAAVIQNNTEGYHNGTTFDFQMLLPQSGLEGSAVSNIAYYFYIELI